MLLKEHLFENILHLGMDVKQSYSTPVTLNAMQSSALDVVRFAMTMYCYTNWVEMRGWRKDCNLQEIAKD